LKPSNLGFSEGEVIQLFDFGLCRELPNTKGQAVHDEDMQDVSEETFHMSGVGTQRYMSPETLNSTRRYNLKTDVYSLSMVCLEMMTWKKPFLEYSPDEHTRLVAGLGERPKLVTNMNEIESAEEATDDELSDVSGESRLKPPSKRLQPVLVSDWPEGLADLLQQAWAHDVAERLTMQSIFDRLGTILEHFASAPMPEQPQDIPPRSAQQTEDWHINDNYGLGKWEGAEVVLEFPSHFTPRHQMSARSRHMEYQEQQRVRLLPQKLIQNYEHPDTSSGPSQDDSEDRWFGGGDRQSEASSSIQELTMTSASTTLCDSTSTS
jgi:serine/threonine protein kinase